MSSIINNNIISNVDVINNIQIILSTWKPSNHFDAIRMLKIVSTFNDKKVIDSVKQLCYDYLDSLEDDDLIIDPETDLAVKKVTRNTIIYNSNNKINSIEKKIKLLEDELKLEKKKAGILETTSKNYYKFH